VGFLAHGLAYMGLFVVMATALSVVIGAVLRDARRTNLVVATAAHAAVNLSLILLFSEEEGGLFPMAVLAAVWTVAAVVVSSVQVRRAVEVEDRAARPVRLG